MHKPVNWVLDADIRRFFDTIDHGWMMKFLEHRIADPRILRLIQKWLKAGVMEDGEWSQAEEGTPQGSVISPLLANIFLHYAFDLWVKHWRQTKAYGRVYVSAMLTTSSCAFKGRVTGNGFWPNCGSVCAPSAWTCTRTRPA